MKLAHTHFGNYCFDPCDVRCPICKNKMEVAEAVLDPSNLRCYVEQKMICRHCFTEVKVKGKLGTVEYTEYEEVETKTLEL